MPEQKTFCTLCHTHTHTLTDTHTCLYLYWLLSFCHYTKKVITGHGYFSFFLSGSVQRPSDLIMFARVLKWTSNPTHPPAPPQAPPLYTCLRGGRRWVMAWDGSGDRVLTTGRWSEIREPSLWPPATPPLQFTAPPSRLRPRPEWSFKWSPLSSRTASQTEVPLGAPLRGWPGCPLWVFSQELVGRGGHPLRLWGM